MARYREIADDLRQRIRAGEFPVGSRLPGISTLQETYDVPGLNTIRAAQQLLVDDGMLAIRQGVGAFVVATEPVKQVNAVEALIQARDTLNTVIAVMAAPRHTVTFDLDDEHSYFVLTQALRDFADQQRSQAEDEDDHQRRQRAEAAEAALERIEIGLSGRPDRSAR